MPRAQAASRIVLPTLPETLVFAHKGPSKSGKMELFAAPTQFEWQHDLLLMVERKGCSEEQIAAFPGWQIVAPLGWAKVG